MKYTILNILFVVFFLSCDTNTQREKMVFALTNDSNKYWYRYHNDTSKPYALGFRFDKNGTYFRYENPNYDVTKRKLFSSPTLSKPIWKIIDDSTLMFGEGIFYRILFLNHDSIVLQNLKVQSSYLKLHRDNDQQSLPSYP